MARKRALEADVLAKTIISEFKERRTKRKRIEADLLNEEQSPASPAKRRRGRSVAAARTPKGVSFADEQHEQQQDGEEEEVSTPSKSPRYIAAKPSPAKQSPRELRSRARTTPAKKRVAPSPKPASSKPTPVAAPARVQKPTGDGSWLNYVKVGSRLHAMEWVPMLFTPIAWMLAPEPIREFFLFNALCMAALFLVVVQLPSYVSPLKGHLCFHAPPFGSSVTPPPRGPVS